MSKSNNLPTLNLFLGSAGMFPQTIPAYSTVPAQDVRPQQGNSGQAPQQGYSQKPWNWNQAQQHYYGTNFSNEIYFLRSKYGLNIPDNEIDQTLEDAKANKRMYSFNEPEKSYVRYDEKGKSYVVTAHTFKWAHKDNSQFFELKKNVPNSYDGTCAYLIKVCWLEMKCKLLHVKPGNYKLYINQSFENPAIKEQMTIRVFVGTRQVFEDKKYPNDNMVQNKELTESYVCSIKKTDFEMDKLDANGDAVVRVEFNGNNNSWKKGWTLDGARLEEEN